MSRDSGGERPTQRTVAELLAEYGSNSQKDSRRRRRRAPEDPTETAPQAIINRVNSDSGRMLPVPPDTEPPPTRRGGPPQVPHGPPQGPPPRTQAGPNPGPPPRGQVGPQTGPQPGPPPAAPPPPAGAPPRPEPPELASPPGGEPPARGGSNYWAQRFASAGKKGPGGQAESEAEMTVRQAAPRRPPARPDAVGAPIPQAGPMPPAGPPIPQAQPQPEGLTEQLPRYGGVSRLDGDYDDPADADPYDFDSAGDYADDGYEAGDDHAADDDYDPDLPAGMAADDYVQDEPDQRPASSKEWGALILQGAGGLIGGGAVWFGFRWLWINFPLPAFVAALVFTGLLVLVAWRILRSNDLQTILLSVLVGLFCTVSPAALLLISI